MTSYERKAFEVYAIGMDYNIERWNPKEDRGLRGYISTPTVIAHLAWEAAIAWKRRRQAKAKQCRCDRCTQDRDGQKQAGHIGNPPAGTVKPAPPPAPPKREGQLQERPGV